MVSFIGKIMKMVKKEEQYEMYIVHAALREDMNEVFVWVQNEMLEKQLTHRRRILCIRTQDGKSVYCEALYVDDDYLKRWKDRLKESLWSNEMWDAQIDDHHRRIFINGWYTHLLGDLHRGYKEIPLSI